MDFYARIRAARVGAVYERLGVSLAITVVSGAAAATALAAGGVSRLVWAWFGLVLILAGLRLAALSAFRRDAALARIGLWGRLAVGGAMASGLLWGLGAALLPSVEISAPGALVGHVVMLLLLGAMCAGAATVHAVHAPTALAFIIPAGVPPALRLAMQGDGRHLLMAAVVLLYILVLALVARRSCRQFDETFRLQIALARRTEELDEANARLRTEIADHRATGESLRQAQRMEAIGQLTGGVAHDFNNVLAVIGGNLQLIARRAEGNPDIRRLAAAAERAAERGARLTASLLSFSREQPLRPETVDLNERIREFAPLLRRTLDGRMELALELAPGPLMALLDPAHFQAALMHLVINARDASPAGRQLTIATSLLPSDDASAEGGHPGPFACVRVIDTGPGMAPEVASRAFEPFFTTREVGQGSGLGLSRVHGFAKQSGGTARIESVEGGGTAVSILLPAQVLQPADDAAPPAAKPDGCGAGRVLLVEDDADVRDVLQESLTSSGWHVISTADGAAARAVLESGVPLDLVISDVVMPGELSGVDLVRIAATLRPDLPVLLISGYPAATLAAQGADERELNLLRKPFTHAELLSRLRQLRATPQPARDTMVVNTAGG